MASKRSDISGGKLARLGWQSEKRKERRFDGASPDEELYQEAVGLALAHGGDIEATYASLHAARHAGKISPGKVNRTMALVREGDAPDVGGPATRPRAVPAQSVLAKPVQAKAIGPKRLTDEEIRARAQAGISDAGQPLPHEAAIQRAFGAYSVGPIRAHIGGSAAMAADDINARAYALGEDIAFSDYPDLYTAAHEAAHVIQQRAGVSIPGGVGSAGDQYERHADAVASAVASGRSAESLLAPIARPSQGKATSAAPAAARAVQRLEGDYSGLGPVEAVAKALDDEEEEDAITLMGRLSASQADQVLNRYQSDATSCFGNDTMGRATRALVRKGGNLAKALEWMFDEGTNWSLLRNTISACSNDQHKAQVRTNRWRDRFVGELGNTEMAALVDLLGGDIAFKLGWMFEEGTDWSAIRSKISAASRAGEDMSSIKTNAWRDRFIGEVDNEEMAQLVDLIGGDIAFKLGWMFEEGTDWATLKTKLNAARAAGEDLSVLMTDTWRERFVSELDNDEMAEAVDIICPTLVDKLQWMRAEGSDWEAIKARIQSAPPDQRTAVYDSDLREFFVSECDDEEMAEAVGLLGGTLVQQLEWMAAEGTNANLILTRVQAASPADRLAVYGNDACKELIRNTVPATVRVQIIQALAGTPAQQMDLFGNMIAISLLTWATPSADWVAAIMAVRTHPHDLLDVAKDNAAAWAPHIRPKLVDLLRNHSATLYPDDRVAVVWAAYDNGSTFSSADIHIIFRAIFGREIRAAGDSVTYMIGGLNRRRYTVVAPDDAAAREMMTLVKTMGRAEVASAQIAFCSRRCKDELTLTGWQEVENNPMPTSYYNGNGYILIKVTAGGAMDSTGIGVAADGAPTAAGGNAARTGLTYFQNHVRHEIGHAVGNRTFGDMDESGNDFAEAYGGWDSSSESAFMGAMWSGQAEPATGWPSVAISGTNVTLTNDDVRDWCKGLLAEGTQVDGPIKNAPGTIQQKLTAIAGSLWGGENLVQYLRAIGSNSPADLRDRGYMFPNFTPTDPVQIYGERGYGGFAKYDKSAHDKLRTTLGWYSLASPVEMFAEMYTLRYANGTTASANNGKDPNTFFTELEGQRDPMFGAPPDTDMGPIF